MIVATKKRAKALGRIVLAVVIVVIVFLGVSIPMMLVLRGREKPREIPWVKVTGPIQETTTFQNGEITLAGTLDLPAGKGPFLALDMIESIFLPPA